MIIEYCVCLFLIGILFGIIGSASPKLFFVIWVLCILHTILDMGNGFNLRGNYNISNWYGLLFLFCCLIGMWVGESSYKLIWKQERRMK